MGKVKKGVGCSVEGCGSIAVKSVPTDKASSAGFKVPSTRGRVYLCEKHWKEYKKALKRDKMLERWRWR
ncbi:MAG: hypothetical protein ACE5GD_01550 [Candidatus Geothermarchaeales archaeon]